jgi:hypothetical protein
VNARTQRPWLWGRGWGTTAESPAEKKKAPELLLVESGAVGQSSAGIINVEQSFQRNEERMCGVTELRAESGKRLAGI